MTVYVDISPFRIQQYLARTPRLRDTAGASARLAAATAEEGLRHLLGTRAEINTEAGEADGVVNLIVPDPDDVDGVIDDVLAKLREELPGAWFQAVTAEAGDYVQAVSLMRRARADGRVREDLPARWEFPFAAPCRLCRTDPAITRVRLGEGDVQDACADCEARHSIDTRTEGTRARRELAELVGREAPANFEELAALGTARKGRNHLATVYADGNAVGDFFDRLADPGNAQAGKRGEVSRRLSTATREALQLAAIEAADDGDTYLCVVPHIVGGDDLLASVPADRVWPFVRTFLGELCGRLKDMADEHGLTAPTVSAGVVIAHDTHPFHMVSDFAYDGLKKAKRHVAGLEASLHLNDVTAGGSCAPLRLTELNDLAGSLDVLAALPQSGRAALTEAWARGGAARAATVARRLDRGTAVEPFLADGAPLDLADALRVARWWR